MSAAERAHTAADAWRALAEAGEDALVDAGRVAASLTGNNSGAAIDAFEKRWRELSGHGCEGELPRLVDACRALAARCDEYAERLSAVPL